MKKPCKPSDTLREAVVPAANNQASFSHVLPKVAGTFSLSRVPPTDGTGFELSIRSRSCRLSCLNRKMLRPWFATEIPARTTPGVAVRLEFYASELDTWLFETEDVFPGMGKRPFSEQYRTKAFPLFASC